MFDDHWYHTATPEPPARLRQQDTVRTQSPARPSLERTYSNAPKKPQPRKLPELPEAEVPARAKSIHDLRSLSQSKLPAASINGTDDAAKPTTLRRFKSRSDLEELKITKFGQSKGVRRVVDLSSVQDELDFAEWYGGFEDQLEDASNDKYRLFHSILESHLMTCDNLLSKTDETLEILDGLQSSFAAIEQQTSAFQESCSSLVSQQARLQSLADSVATNLQPFTELEPITRVLARPGSDFVKTPSFRDMLVKLDRCLEWMNDPAHAAFPDVETYAPKFRHCMTRALTLIRNYYVSSVREVAEEVVAKMKERKMTENTPSALLYAKFRVNAPFLRDLIGEIESRCDHEEYVSLLNECYEVYASVRQKLVIPIVSKHLMDLSNATNASSKDLVNFASSAIISTRSICFDEFDLFFAYFSSERGEGEIYNFLETICEPLCDYLRPRIIHEVNLVKLCELCSLLQTRYMRDLEDPEIDPYDRTHLDFGQLIQSILHDTQTRVVFRAQAVIRTEIEQFTPQPADLDYPAKCRRLRNTKPSTEGSNTPLPLAPVVVDSSSITDPFDTEAMFAGWYPTLRKCIWLLSKIYRLVNSSVFDDLAHTIVHATVHSLLVAVTHLQKSAGEADAQLFLLRHLLQLKSQLIAFDIEFSAQPDVEITFGPSLESIRTNMFSLSSILQLIREATMPKVVTNMPDAKQELDMRLRVVIEDFTNSWAARMTEAITGASNRIASADAPDPALNVRLAIERELPKLREKVADYVEDVRTSETLVAAVQEAVVDRYGDYYEMAKNGMRGKGWDPSTFEDWCIKTFAVELEEDDDCDTDSMQGEREDEYADQSV